MENAMCSHDNYISPYLRRRLRTHAEIVREEAERTEPESPSKASAETGPHGPGQGASDDVEPTR